MSKRTKQYPPNVVVKNCRQFIAALEIYRKLLRDAFTQSETNYQRDCKRALPKGEDAVEKVRHKMVHLRSAHQLWIDLKQCGQRLLSVGQSWNMSEWTADHREWLPSERSGFFPGDAVEDGDMLPAGLDWGLDLERFLLWGKTTGKPLGFSGHKREEPCLLEWVIDDVARDVNALLAAANERALGKPSAIDPRRALTARERAVLDLIPVGISKAIKGPEIFKRLLSEKRLGLSQSVLTTYITPKLISYGVINRPGFGYYRT